MNDSKINAILKKAYQPSGPGNFEVLLGANFFNGSSPDAQALAMRFYSDMFVLVFALRFKPSYIASSTPARYPAGIRCPPTEFHKRANRHMEFRRT
jgi:hypothetical protein